MSAGFYTRRKTPFQVFEANLLKANNEQLVRISQELGIGLNLGEMKAVQAYFRRKQRNPTDVELQTIGQTWSEHCFHKTFKGKITFNGKRVNSRVGPPPGGD